MRYAVPASLWHRPKPSVAWAFGGVKVHRTFTCYRLTHWTLCNAPVHPWLGRSPGQQSTGLLSCSARPPDLHLDRLTHWTLAGFRLTLSTPPLGAFTASLAEHQQSPIADTGKFHILSAQTDDK